MKYVCKEYELKKEHETDSGYDIRTVEDIFIKPLETVKIRTGLFLDIPAGFEVQVRPKSGLSSKGFSVELGTVDEGYTGEVMVTAKNTTRNRSFTFQKLDKVAQIVLCKRTDTDVELKKVKKIEKETDRGANGFGSTGIR